MTDADAIAEIERAVFAASPTRERRPNAEIVKRVAFLVARVRECQANEDNLFRVIAALEAGEAKRQSK